VNLLIEWKFIGDGDDDKTGGFDVSALDRSGELA
jgi:hypothetical protein